MKNNTYRLYQMKDTPDTVPFIHQSFETLKKRHYYPARKDYDLVSSGMMNDEDNVRTVCERIQAKQQKSQAHRPMGIGDILVIRHEVVTCYFFDTMGFAILDGFNVEEEESTTLRLSGSSRNISLSGCLGHWDVINSIAVETTSFFLLQSVEFGCNTGWLISDQFGNIIIEDNRTGFDGVTVQKLREYLRPELSASPPKRHHAPEKHNMPSKTEGNDKATFQTRVSLRLRLQEKQREIQIETRKSILRADRKAGAAT